MAWTELVYSDVFNQLLSSDYKVVVVFLINFSYCIYIYIYKYFILYDIKIKYIILLMSYTNYIFRTRYSV